MKQIIQKLVVCFLGLLSLNCKAEIYEPVEVNPYSQRLPKKMFLPEIVEEKNWFEEHALETLPNTVLPTDSGYSVMNKIADNGISVYWKNSALRNSSVGQTIEATEKKMNVQASVKDSSNVEHKFNLKLLAAQSSAKFEYTGWLNVAFNYDVRNANTTTEIIEKLSKQQDLVMSHIANNSEKKSAVSLRWNW